MERPYQNCHDLGQHTTATMIPSFKIPFALSVILILAVSVHATLVPGSEKGVTAPAPDVAAFDQAAAQMATDGDSFMAVWIDHTLSGVGDIHGARISSDGKRVDDEALLVAVTDADENRVAIAWGSGRYLAVWSTRTALRARFIARDAAMSDVLEIAALPNGFTQPQLAFNGHVFLVTWSASSMFRGAVVSVNGELLKTFDVASTAQTFSETALVAANGTFHFVTAIADFNGVPNGNGYPSDVGVTTIDENGAVAARTVIAPATTPVFDVRAVSSGTEFLVGWSTAIEIPGGTVRSVRVTAAGASAVDVVPSEGMYLQSVGVSGNGFLVVYGSSSLKLAYLPGVNTPISFVPIHLTPSVFLDVASNGARTFGLVRGLPRVGFEYGPAGGDLYVMRFDTQTLEPLVVAPRHQSSPDIAAAGDLRLATWCEYIGSDRRLGIVASRLSADGDAIDVNGIDLGANVYHPAAPRVASNGTDWLVVWVDATNLYGVRVARDGTRLDTNPILIASGIFENSDLAVSWDGAWYVVVYFRGIFLRGLHTTLRASKMAADGTLATGVSIFLSTDGANEFPAIASGNHTSIIVWRNGLSLAGALFSGAGVTSLAFPATHPVGPRPAIAWNNGTFLVAAPFRGPFGDEIQWQLVSATGVVSTPLSTFVHLDATLIAGGGYPSVEVEPYGDGFMLFWNGIASDAQQRTANVFAARINRDGILADGPTFIGTTLVDYTPGIGATGNTIVYSRKIDHATRELARVYSRNVQSVAGKPRRRAVR